MKMLKIAAALSFFALTSVANAAVTFDNVSGTGFVGKGDVQLAFGWNNSQLQERASGVSFGYFVSTAYEAVCVWTTGEGRRGEKTHRVTHKGVYSLSNSINVDTRVRNQITGFFLTGYPNAGTADTGAAPVAGAPCPGNEGHDGVWENVSVSEQADGLVVTYGTKSVDLSY